MSKTAVLGACWRRDDRRRRPPDCPPERLVGAAGWRTQVAQAGPALDERLAWIASEFERARVEHHAPGAALAVIKDGEVVSSRASAWRTLTPGAR